MKKQKIKYLNENLFKDIKMKNKSSLFRIAGIFGILLPLIVFTFIGISIYYAPWFSWTENWLSELGGTAGETPIYAARGVSSIIFNVGLIIAGGFGVICAFATSKIKVLKNSLGNLGTSLLIADMFALLAIGIFPLTIEYMHEKVSFLFFFLVPLSLIPIGLVLKNTEEKKFGWLIIMLGVASSSSFPLFFVPQPWGSNAVIEMIPATSLSICAIIFGINLLKDNFELVNY